MHKKPLLEDNLSLFKNENIVGKRFGRLVVRSFSEDVFECQCDCGQIIDVPKAQLLRCEVLSCGDCKPSPRFVRRYACLTFGKITDYDYESAWPVCSYCGAPDVVAKGLCRACYIRSSKTENGTCEYPPREFVVRKLKEAALNQRAAKRSQEFSLARKYQGADEMFRLYTEGGLTYREIGDRFGVSRQRVYQILHSHYKRDKKF